MRFSSQKEKKSWHSSWMSICWIKPFTNSDTNSITAQPGSEFPWTASRNCSAPNGNSKNSVLPTGEKSSAKADDLSERRDLVFRDEQCTHTCFLYAGPVF